LASSFDGSWSVSGRPDQAFNKVVLMSSPMAHQTGFMYGLMMAPYLGAKNVLQDTWVPEQAADIIEAEGATFIMASTPFRGGARHRVPYTRGP
jgi:acyl-CoA synthetase (AMP-forming)/AMP-acid ligase II